jgi:thymidylate synthase
MGERQYLELLRRVINEGVLRRGRNGNTVSLFGEQLRFDLRDSSFPLLTTKKMPIKAISYELSWFSQGFTSNKYLTERNVKIWTPNAEAGPIWRTSPVTWQDLGPIYGFQWRHFGANYLGSPEYLNMHYGIDAGVDSRIIETSIQGVDQLRWIVDELRENPGTRRAILSAWNPVDIPKMALPPCHVMSQYWIGNDGLRCHMYQRSADVGLGVPFNIASYALLTNIIAKCVGVPARELVMSFGDTHVYEEHIEGLKEQILREPGDAPQLELEWNKEWTKTYPDEFLKWSDENKFTNFILKNYSPQETIRLGMVA